MALVTKAPRAATVRAVGRARLLKIGYGAFEPKVLAKCGAVLRQRTTLYAAQATRRGW
jgi:CRP-like cAMP-binding protein